jgi:hypothetical protein
MTGPQNFSAKERERFRKLLEVANSTTYEGEKNSALAAATRLARSHDMSLHEAAGMQDEDGMRRKARFDRHQKSNRPSASKDTEFGETFRAKKGTHHNQSEFLKAEKHRYEQAMAEAIQRGLNLDKSPISSKRPNYARRSGTGAWRSRPDFIRVLLRETRMTAREIAATVGVSIHDVFKEKLLMRQT